MRLLLPLGPILHKLQKFSKLPLTAPYSCVLPISEKPQNCDKASSEVSSQSPVQQWSGGRHVPFSAPVPQAGWNGE